MSDAVGPGDLVLCVNAAGLRALNSRPSHGETRR
jgi:hypothetical protein